MATEHDPFGWYADVPLTTPQTIRVLKLHGLQEGRDNSTSLECEIRTTSLDGSDHPLYASLSYTWGDPVRTADDSSALVTEEKAEKDIFCHGRCVPIGRNLHAALLTYR